MYAARWFERLFQSCQRKSNNESSKDEHLSEDQHRLLNYDQLPNFGNDVLSSAYLKTLRFLAWSIDKNTKKVEASSSEQPDRSSTSSCGESEVFSLSQINRHVVNGLIVFVFQLFELIYEV
ncbi:unnamed protein product, partial [Rotaria magnacalcarata]